MSKLGCIGSGNKLQKQKKGPWNLGKRKAKVSAWGRTRGGRETHLLQRGELVLERRVSLTKILTSQIQQAVGYHPKKRQISLYWILLGHLLAIFLRSYIM